MNCDDANTLFRAMGRDIAGSPYFRKVSDPKSPRQGEVVEAPPFNTYILDGPLDNLVNCKPVDHKWALAYVLHFFTADEEAACLRKYNQHADKFLTGDKWIGSYGSIGMPQVQHCITALTADINSRRAIVTITRHDHFENADLNIPSCPTSFHFLVVNNRLHMHVYQRSLNWWTLAAADLALYTNIQHYVACNLQISSGKLYWTVGSLHATREDLSKPYIANLSEAHPHRTMLVPMAALERALAVLDNTKYFDDVLQESLL